jgi:hypothetical protein
MIKIHQHRGAVAAGDPRALSRKLTSKTKNPAVQTAGFFFGAAVHPAADLRAN